MRAGQSFAMRYPLIEVRGNAGTLLSSGNWAAERYTKARLSKLATYLFNDIDKILLMIGVITMLIMNNILASCRQRDL